MARAGARSPTWPSCRRWSDAVRDPRGPGATDIEIDSGTDHLETLDDPGVYQQVRQLVR